MEIQELRLKVNYAERALHCFKEAADWIKRHEDCDTCDIQEWKALAKTLSKMINIYLDLEKQENENPELHSQ